MHAKTVALIYRALAEWNSHTEGLDNVLAVWGDESDDPETLSVWFGRHKIAIAFISDGATLMDIRLGTNFNGWEELSDCNFEYPVLPMWDARELFNAIYEPRNFGVSIRMVPSEDEFGIPLIRVIGTEHMMPVSSIMSVTIGDAMMRLVSATTQLLRQLTQGEPGGTWDEMMYGSEYPEEEDSQEDNC